MIGIVVVTRAALLIARRASTWTIVTIGWSMPGPTGSQVRSLAVISRLKVDNGTFNAFAAPVKVPC
jgi:hypothetical protein